MDANLRWLGPIGVALCGLLALSALALGGAGPASLARDINTTTTPGGLSPGGLTVVGDTLYLSGAASDTGSELWASDGSAAGTRLVKDINPGRDSSSPSGLTNVGGTLFFAADDGASGAELWASDGTAAGTRRVRDLFPGAHGSSPTYLTDVGGTLFFAADTYLDSYGRLVPGKLWKSDGTATGTVQVMDVSQGADQALFIDGMESVGGALFFATDDGALWRSDGSEAGTLRLLDLAAYGGDGFPPSNLTGVGGTLFFSKYDEAHGQELWKSDGTRAGTVLVRDINPGADGSNPSGLSDARGTLVFVASTASFGAELWRSDGSAAGTAQIQDLAPWGASSNPGGFTRSGGRLFFGASTHESGRELWSLDLADLLRTTVTPISAVGGVAVSGDGRARASFPAGAVAADVAVTVTTPDAPAHPPPAGWAVAFPISIAAVDRAGLPVTRLVAPMRLSLSYTAADLAARGLSGQALGLAAWDGRQWAMLPPWAGCGAGPGAGVIVADVDRLTEFAVMACRPATMSSEIYLPAVLTSAL